MLEVLAEEGGWRLPCPRRRQCGLPPSACRPLRCPRRRQWGPLPCLRRRQWGPLPCPRRRQWRPLRFPRQLLNLHEEWEEEGSSPGWLEEEQTVVRAAEGPCLRREGEGSLHCGP